MDMQCVERLAEAAIVPEQGDYTQDGLLYCGKCHTAKQCRVKLLGMERIMPCSCDCAARERAEQKQTLHDLERESKIKDLRSQGIAFRDLQACTFEAASRKTPELAKARQYVDQWPEMRKNGTGLMFWGNLGNGKTYTAACIANALIDKGIPVMMTSFPLILNATFEERDNLAARFRSYPLLVIDDLGAERRTEYAMETMFAIVDERYRAGAPVIITTNLTLDAMRTETALDAHRIYDRLLEMCLPVYFGGASIRQERMHEKQQQAAQILGWRRSG